MENCEKGEQNEPTEGKLYSEAIKVKVNLETIVKYHKASEAEMSFAVSNGLSPQEYETTINFVYQNQTKGGKTQLHPAFNYPKIDDTGVPEHHFNNLLYLTQSLIQWEWTTYSYNIHENLDLKGLAKEDIKELLILLAVRDNQEFDRSKLRLEFTPVEIDKRTHTSFIIKSQAIMTSLVDTLIEEKFEQIRDSYSHYLTSHIYRISKPTFESISKLYDELPDYDFPHYKAKTLFRKLVVETLLAYLNGEKVLITPKNEDVTLQQGEIIYPLLAIFNLLEQKHIDGHQTLRDKTKYIRSLIQSPETRRLYNKKKKGLDKFLQIVLERLKI